MTSTDGRLGRYVIHLPVTAVDLTGALALGRVLARSVGWLTQIDANGTELSEEDNQNVRHQLFCDRRLDGSSRRCGRAAGHGGGCG
ncbi:hypothetical protein ACI2K4_13310 [Micromonospora sp. NPDC050397]|uniref:hypothetical protein n=1 Tax=Micromonospora sp. NPDC050397 TaxID=3364279 RepID=UPI00384D2803